MTSESFLDNVRAMYSAVAAGRVAEARRLLSEHAELRKTGGIHATWLHDAARYGNVEMISMLISEGMDVNASGVNRPDGPLSGTLGRGHIAAAALLLDHGASPNVGRLLIGAINAKQNSFALVKLLVEHGVNVNQCWRFGDDEHGPLFNALSWAIDSGREDIADYLRAHGAVMPPEETAKPRSSASEEIIAYFEQRFGPVSPQALREIVPSSDFPVIIHRAPPTATRNSIILFTTGMSEQPMRVPDDAEDYKFAELLMELPADWPLPREALANLDHRWPVDWLRKVAGYPCQEQTWLGGPFAIMANGDPPAPFAPGCKFSAMLLAASYDGVGPMSLSNGRMVQIYTIIPMYSDEWHLEHMHGLPELFRRFDQFGIARLVTLDRPSVASTAGSK